MNDAPRTPHGPDTNDAPAPAGWDALARRDLAIAALCFGLSGLLLARLLPPLGLSLAGAALGLVTARAAWRDSVAARPRPSRDE